MATLLCLNRGICRIRPSEESFNSIFWMFYLILKCFRVLFICNFNVLIFEFFCHMRKTVTWGIHNLQVLPAPQDRIIIVFYWICWLETCCQFKSQVWLLQVHPRPWSYLQLLFIQIQVPDDQFKITNCKMFFAIKLPFFLLLLVVGAVYSLRLNLPPLWLHNMHWPHVASQFIELYTQQWTPL